MGALLSLPVTKKDVNEGGNEAYGYSASSMQGWRNSMEDAHVAQIGLQGDPDAALFAVFDGHCGSEVAQFAARYVVSQLERTQGWQAGSQAGVIRGLQDTFLRLDQALMHDEVKPFLRGIASGADVAAADNALSRPARRWPAALAMADDHMALYPPPGLQQPNLDTRYLAVKVDNMLKADVKLATPGGCTAVAAVVRRGTITVANSGDSRAVMCRRGRAVELSFDHKPDNPSELQRISRAGGFVRNGRVSGCLALSRSLGDLGLKRNGALTASQQMITAMPDVIVEAVTEEDEFLVLACDGIWEMRSSQEVVDFVRSRLVSGMSPSQAAAELFDECLAPVLYSDAALKRVEKGKVQAGSLLRQPMSGQTARRDQLRLMNQAAEEAHYRSGLQTAANSLRAAEAAQCPDQASASQQETGTLGAVSGVPPGNSRSQESQVAVEMAFDMWRRFPWLDRYQVLKLHIEIHAQLGSGRRVVPTSDKQSPWLEPQEPRPVGPDSESGHGCDNMTLLIVMLKPSLQRTPSPARSNNGAVSTHASAAATRLYSTMGRPGLRRTPHHVSGARLANGSQSMRKGPLIARTAASYRGSCTAQLLPTVSRCMCVLSF